MLLIYNKILLSIIICIHLYIVYIILYKVCSLRIHFSYSKTFDRELILLNLYRVLPWDLKILDIVSNIV